MTNFYYQIKGRAIEFGFNNWDWPPIFSGKVSAKNKKDAKSLIEENYDRKFPLRVLKKDLENESFLLSIREINEEDERTRKLFDYITCQECEKKFRIIDKYNDRYENNKGSEYCSSHCRHEHDERNRMVTPKKMLEQNNGVAVIYRIKNINTNMVYIGKTYQVFTLRWYQHFYQSGSTKFHLAIQSTKLTDWEFSIIEVVEAEKGDDPDTVASQRESHWIDHYNSIISGYNSMPIKSKINAE